MFRRKSDGKNLSVSTGEMKRNPSTLSTASTTVPWESSVASTREKDLLKALPALHKAIYTKEADKALQILKKKFDGNQIDKIYYRTALHWCAAMRRADVAKAIVDARDRSTKPLDFDAVDVDGRSAVSLAALNKDGETLKLLLGKSTRAINLRDNFQNTPLFYAVTNNDSSTITLLSQNGADLNSKTNDGDSMLIVAIKLRNFFAAVSLIHNGANLSVTDIQNNTALHYAVEAQQVPLVKALLAKNANLNIKNKAGKSPADIAEEHARIASLASAGRVMTLDENDNPVEAIHQLLTKATVKNETGATKPPQAFSGPVSPTIARKINQLIEVEVVEETPIEEFKPGPPPVAAPSPVIAVTLPTPQAVDSALPELEKDTSPVDQRDPDPAGDDESDIDFSDVSDALVKQLEVVTAASTEFLNQSSNRTSDVKKSNSLNEGNPAEGDGDAKPVQGEFEGKPSSAVDEALLRPIEAPPVTKAPPAPIAPAAPMLKPARPTTLPNPIPITAIEKTGRDDAESLRMELLKERTANQALRQAIAETETKRKGQRSQIDEMQEQIDWLQSTLDERDAKVSVLEKSLALELRQKAEAASGLQREMNGLKADLKLREDDFKRLQEKHDRLQTELEDKTRANSMLEDAFRKAKKPQTSGGKEEGDAFGSQEQLVREKTKELQSLQQKLNGEVSLRKQREVELNAVRTRLQSLEQDHQTAEEALGREKQLSFQDKTELEDLLAQLDELRHVLGEREAELNEERETSIQLQVQLQELNENASQTAVENAAQTIRTLQQQLDTTREELDNIKQTLVDTKDENQIVRSELTQMQKHNRDEYLHVLQEQLGNEKQARAKLQVDYTTAMHLVSQIEGDLNDVRKLYAAEIKNVEMLDHQRQTMERRLMENQTDAHEVQQKFEMMQQICAKSESQRNELQQRLDAAMGQCDQLRGEMSQVRHLANKQHDELTDVKKQLIPAEEEHKELLRRRTEVNELRMDLEKHKASLESKDRHVVALMTELEQNQRALASQAEHTAEFKTLQEQNKELKGIIEQHEMKIREKQEELAHARVEQNQLQSVIHGLKDSITKLETRIQDQKQALADLSDAKNDVIQQREKFSIDAQRFAQLRDQTEHDKQHFEHTIKDLMVALKILENHPTPSRSRRMEPPPNKLDEVIETTAMAMEDAVEILELQKEAWQKVLASFAHESYYEKSTRLLMHQLNHTIESQTVRPLKSLFKNFSRVNSKLMGDLHADRLKMQSDSVQKDASHQLAMERQEQEFQLVKMKLDSQLGALQAALQEKSTNLQSVGEKSRDRESRLEVELTSTKRQLDDVQKSLAQKEAALAQLSDRSSVLETQEASERMELGQLRQHVATLQRQVDDLTLKNHQLSTELAERTSRTNDQTSVLRAQQDEILELKQQLKRASGSDRDRTVLTKSLANRLHALLTSAPNMPKVYIQSGDAHALILAVADRLELLQLELLQQQSNRVNQEMKLQAEYDGQINQMMSDLRKLKEKLHGVQAYNKQLEQEMAGMRAQQPMVKSVLAVESDMESRLAQQLAEVKVLMRRRNQ